MCGMWEGERRKASGRGSLGRDGGSFLIPIRIAHSQVEKATQTFPTSLDGPLYAPSHHKPFPEASSLLHFFSPCLSCFGRQASGRHPGWLRGTRPAQHPDPGGRHWQGSQARASADLPCISPAWLVSARSVIKRGFLLESITSASPHPPLSPGVAGAH